MFEWEVGVLAKEDKKVAIVTGAAGGLGRMLVRAALDVGYCVGALDRDQRKLDELVAELAGENREELILPHCLNIAEESDCNEAVAAVEGHFGRLDALVNAAGIGMVVIRDDHMLKPIRFDEVTSDEWDSFFDINTKGPFLMAKATLPYMTGNQWGRIVNVTTSMDTMFKLGFCPYGPSKAALEANTAIWAQELSGTGVTVNVLTPGGATDTPMLAKLPFSRSGMIQPEVMQGPLKWLLSAESDSVTGRRFVGVFWDPNKDAAVAAEESGGPAAWPDSGKQGIWPT